MESLERAALIDSYLPLADRLSRRYRRTGEAQDDLRQVAALALVRAVDRRDPARAASFTAYVVRCMEGEVRRHLRDLAAPVRVPRSVDPASAVAARAPVPFEEADLPVDADGAEEALDRALVARAARRLDAREREVVLLRYFLDRTQTQIGEDLGLSQAHVSRLLAGALAKMRRDLSPPLCRRARSATLDASGNASDTRSGDG